MGRLSIILILMTATAALPRVAAAQEPPATRGADTVAQDLREQETILNNPTATPQQRDEAARRLVSRGSPEAREIIRKVVGNPVNQLAQTAMARALATDPNPDPALVDPLAALMGPDRALTEAAAQALAQEMYCGVDAAWPRLRDRVAAQNLPTRVGIVRALAKLVNKQVAATLLGLMNDDANEDVRNAAADALVEISGQPNLRRDTNLIRKWWADSAQLPDAQWRQNINDQRARRLPEVKDAMERFYERARLFIKEQYRATPAAQRDPMLLKLLGDDTPQMRRIGVSLVRDDFNDNKRPSADVAAQLYKMVGDSATEVRQEVARTLSTLNDENAIPKLVAQFGQERDVEVRVAIAEALGPMSVGKQDLLAVEPLLSALNDESSRVARGAAASLKELAPIAAKRDPALAKRMGDVLQKRLTTTERGLPLRDYVAETMGALGLPGMLNDFYHLLDRQESPRVRLAALRGLANIGNPDAANEATRWLDDPEGGVRLQAAITVGKLGAYPHVDGLLRRLSPTIEKDAKVAEAAWDSIMVLAPRGSANDLNNLADQLNKGDLRNPERRLAVLRVEEKKLEAAKSYDELAPLRQNIGDACTELPKPDRVQAEAAYEQAYNYWVGLGVKAESLYDPLILRIMDCFLRSHEYPKAMQFATKVVAMDKKYTETVGRAVQIEIERLRGQKEYDKALELIGEAEKVLNVFGSMYAANFKDLKERILRDKSGMPWLPDYTRPFAWRTPAAPAPLSLPCL